jgi:glycosyltransferase involved in cell wall biosynthesis
LRAGAGTVIRLEAERISTPPLVSVVIATYNRSRVLAHAIESVRRSTLADFELIVVGDHCTDDTSEVVRSFDDERITYVNLPQNVGEQSGPNNEGVRLARGRYIAFLNHDDMYFPDHLASAVSFCEQSGADLVWGPLLVALPASESELASGCWRFRLSGVPAGQDYDPRVFVFASAWLMKRELTDAVGPWQPAHKTFVSSSQDWLFRAWRSGARLRFCSGVSVLAVPAGARDGSYTADSSPEHEFFSTEMRENPRFRDTALEIAAIAGERETNNYRMGRSPAAAVRGLLFGPASAASLYLGVHPYAPIFALRHGRRGNLINALRRRTGLKKLVSERTTGRTPQR